MRDDSTGFTIVREFEASPEELWEAWTDEDAISDWWHPRGVHTPRETVAVDARLGGSYAYTMVNDETRDEYPTVGVYSVFEPVERLAFTWGTAEDADEDRPLITVTLEPLGERTRLTLELVGAAGAPGDEYMYDGWVHALEFLEQHVGGGEVR